MGRWPQHPAYSLEEARRLVRGGRVSFTKRARRFVQNHYGYFDFNDVSLGVFEAMGDEHFYKSEELEHRPGTYADIYKGMVYDGIEWYVKFFVDEDGEARVEVWTMCWDGAVH